jgi:hypothetical protein
VRLAFDNRRQHHGHILTIERRPAGGHFVEHATKGPDVREDVSLTLQASQSVGVSGERRREDLDGHLPLELRMLGPI